MSHFSYSEDFQGVADVFLRDPHRYAPLLQFIENVMTGPSDLTKAEREMIAAHVSKLNACNFCLGAHKWTLAAMDVDRYLPGHGPVLEDREYLERVIRLVEVLLSRAREAVEAGLDREETLQRIRLEEERLPFTGGDPVHVNRMLRELRERNLVRVVDQMLTVINPDGLAEIAGFDEDMMLTCPHF